MKNTLTLFCLAALFIVSCKKDDADPKPQPEVTQDTVEQIIEIKTDFGTMYMWLYKGTPLHRANFLGLADTNFFDGTTFHRCVKDFVIQGGDPNSKDDIKTNDGQGGPGYLVPAEINSAKFKHKRGAVGAARNENPEKSSNGSQFYIVLPAAGTPSLNGKYTVFGEVIQGMEVADSIVLQPKGTGDRPITDIKMDINVVEKTTRQLREQFNFFGYQQ